MNLTIILTDEQMAELAQAVAAQLGGMSCNGKAAHSVKETATRLGVSEVTVKRRIKAGIIPRVPGLGRVLVPSRYFETL